MQMGLRVNNVNRDMQCRRSDVVFFDLVLDEASEIEFIMYSTLHSIVVLFTYRDSSPLQRRVWLWLRQCLWPNACGRMPEAVAMAVAQHPLP